MHPSGGVTVPLKKTIRCLYGKRTRRTSLAHDVLGLRTTIGVPSISLRQFLNGVRGSRQKLIDIECIRVYSGNPVVRDRVVSEALQTARRIFERNGFSFGRVDWLYPNSDFVEEWRNTTWPGLLLLRDGKRSGSLDVFFVENMPIWGRGTIEGTVVEIDTRRSAEAIGRTLAHEIGHSLGLAHRLPGSDNVAGFRRHQESLMTQTADIEGDPMQAIWLGETERNILRGSSYTRRGC